MDIQENYSLKNLNTFGIAAAARFFAEVNSESEVLEALEFAQRKDLGVFVLGGGSNILLSDAGFDGLVIHNKVKSQKLKVKSLEIGAGESWDEVVKLAVENNLAGIECLSGVPGTAGGAVAQNIGAYGQTLGDAVSEVRVIEAASGELKIFSKEQCEFEYRNSFFKRNPGKFIVTSVILMLSKDIAPNVSYPHVKKHFGQKLNPTLAEVREFIIKLRASKGYLIMPGYECYQTAGSFFKNPIISQDRIKELELRIKDKDEWFWEMPGEQVKVAAAKLLEKSGFSKGYREGAVGISPKHSLSLINLGKARAQEIKALADEIKRTVRDKFDVLLEEEVLYIGNFIQYN